MQETNLAPGLLLSMPQLSDPNFTRAVVLMLDHGDEGSFGLIVNQQSDMPVAELMSHIDVAWNGAQEDCVWSGGPVMPGSGWVLHSENDPQITASTSFDEALESTGILKIVDGLYMSTSEQHIRRLALSPAPRTRFLLGYAGWSGGQLAAEMATGSWLHANIDIDTLFDAPADEMWERCLRHAGIDPDAIVQSRGIH